MAFPSYIVLTPVRNEAEYLPKTIACLAAQTRLPVKWIVINDGSTDATSAILAEASRQYPWLQVVNRQDRGFRKSGGGVVEAFYDGYEATREVDWDYIVKLDGDLSFAPNFFEDCLTHFVRAPKLGIGGGTICHDVAGELVPESQGDPPFHVRGATKIYRRACWEAIGGLIKAPGWDTVDEIKANMLGWTTRSFPELKLHHHRYAGNADGTWKNWVKNGRANYITGYHPLFMLCKCLSRLRDKPFLVVSAGLGFGYLSGYWKRIARVDDDQMIKYLRDQQIRRLTLRDSLWIKRA